MEDVSGITPSRDGETEELLVSTPSGDAREDSRRVPSKSLKRERDAPGLDFGFISRVESRDARHTIFRTFDDRKK